jgi:putative membrane protein
MLIAAAVASAVHVLSLGIGLGAIFARGRALTRLPLDIGGVLYADNWWGVAAVLWIASGLARLLFGLDKPTEWYFTHPLFHLKMALFAVAGALELWPMMVLIKWRLDLRKGLPPDLRPVRLMGVINRFEVVLIAMIPLVAAAMARGLGR